MVRVRFAGTIPRTRWLEIGFWLSRRIESPRFRKIETIYPNAHVPLLRITEAAQLDREVAAWLREAYAVGCQEHLRGQRLTFPHPDRLDVPGRAFVGYSPARRSEER